MKLYIKFMVSLRCKMVVKAILESLAIQYRTVELGEVDLFEDEITNKQYNILKVTLIKSGLELLNDKKSVIIERIKNIVIEIVHYSDDLPRTKLSVYISEKLHYDYTYLANLFSASTGISIAQFMLNHKIEKVKELILYDELTLTEISNQLHYSNVSHLSKQFKKVTGLTPTHFKTLNSYKKDLCSKVSKHRRSFYQYFQLTVINYAIPAYFELIDII